MVEGYTDIEIERMAQELALLSYDIIVSSRDLNGKLKYTAYTPELEYDDTQCAGSGYSIAEAVENLINNRVYRIKHLITNNILVPPPNCAGTGERTYNDNAITTTRIVADIGAKVEPYERTTTQHVEYYDSWDKLWVAILNDDVLEFDIFDKPYKWSPRKIRVRDNEWVVLRSGSYVELQEINPYIYSKPALFAVIGYISKFDLRRVRCLPKTNGEESPNGY